MNNMDNDHIIKELAKITQWQEDHERHDDERFSKIEDTLANIPKREEMDEIVRQAMTDTFLTVGKTTKMTLITVATIIGAIAVIGGGARWILELFGFSYMVK